MIKLYIENKLVELDENFSAPITKTFENLNNPTQIINTYSKTITIPHTQNNDRLFGFLFNPDRLTAREGTTLTGIYFDPYQKIAFRLEYNDYVLMTGYLKVLTVTSKGYECSLNGELGKIFQEMKTQKYDFSKYFNGIISKELLKECWESTSNSLTLRKRGDSGYKASDIIGFFPSNALNSNFDYKTVETLRDNRYIDAPFATILKEGQPTFEIKNNCTTETAIGEGLTPNGYGEFRSWLQQPFIYFNQLFQIFQEQSEETTGYTFNLDDSWFNKYNPYWSKLAVTGQGLSFASTSSTLTGTLSYNGTSEPLRTFTPTDYAESIGKFNMYGKYVGTGDVDWTTSLETNLSINVPVGINAINVKTSSINATISVQGFISTDEVRLNPNSGIYVSLGYYTIAGTFIQTVPLWVITDSESTLDVPNIKTVKIDKLQWKDNKHQITVELPITETQVKSSMIGGDSYTLYLVCSQEPNTQGRLLYKHITGDWQFTNQTTTISISKSFSYDIHYETGTYRSGSYFSISTLIGSKNVFDIILQYCKMFRLLIITDETKKILTFIPASKYFADYKIVKKEIDKSKDFTVKPITWENKYILFDYNEDKSALAKQYKDTRGYNYGELRLETNYKFNNETKKIFEGDLLPTIIYNSTDVSWVSLYELNDIVYTVSNNQFIDNRDDSGKEIDNGFYRFVFVKLGEKFDQDSNMRPWKVSDDSMNQTTKQKYYYSGDNDLYVTSVNSYTMPSFSFDQYSIGYNTPEVLYSNDSIGKSIYDSFWKEYINERYNTQNKIVTCYIKMTPSDFCQFEFNRFLSIGNQIYMVNKIYDYDYSSNYVKADLITVQNIKAYASYDLEGYIKLNKNSITLYKWQDSGSVYIDSSSDWTALSSAGITVNPSKGSYGKNFVNIKTNDMQQDGEVIFRNEQEIAKTLTVIGRDSELTVEPSNITLNKKKDSKVVTITSTYYCDIDDGSVAGFYASPTYVEAGVHQITVNSDLVNADKATVTIKQKDGKQETINITFV